MLILRAGLTGCLAACVIPDSRIIDEDTSPTFHKAVLRFRSDAVSKATGIPFKKIRVSKSVFDGECFVPWNPLLANQYSMKVIDGIYDRSIENLETVTRWLAPEDFHEQMMKILSGRIQWGATIDYNNFKEPVISTLPMDNLLMKIGEPDDSIYYDRHYNEIYVTTLNLKIPCDVHQTVYFPEPSCEVYRATLEGEKLIIECTDPITMDDIEWIPGIFALQDSDWYLLDMNHEQRIGKIAPIDDKLRKDTIQYITEHYNIYSLGRTAIWKNILLDDCLQDIQRIQEMMNKSKYDRMLGR